MHSLPLTRQALQFLLCLSLILPLSSFLACLSFHLTGSFCCRVAKDCCLPFVRGIMRLVAPPLTIKLHRTRPPKFSTEHARPKKSLAGIVEQNRNREKSFSNSNGNSLELEDCLMFMFVGEIREIDAKKTCHFNILNYIQAHFRRSLNYSNAISMEPVLAWGPASLKPAKECGMPINVVYIGNHWNPLSMCFLPNRLSPCLS